MYALVFFSLASKQKTDTTATPKFDPPASNLLFWDQHHSAFLPGHVRISVNGKQHIESVIKHGSKIGTYMNTALAIK